MLDRTPTTADLLDAIETERRYWHALVEAMRHAGLLNEFSEGEDSWTFRDVAVHLNGWREWTLTRLTAGLHAANSPTPPWPEGLDEESQVGTDAINAWFAARARQRPMAEVLAETDAQFDALAAAVTAMPDADLLTPGRFP
ncbi:MAG TPA: maleylpyruvate isomerase N-terminal domain-containing protein [Thermomicrobiales bacterium]|nr:maleylpyruvate isomerase N-terminal domain-containing protein [Thermomicrobiales bacterium]